MTYWKKNLVLITLIFAVIDSGLKADWEEWWVMWLIEKECQKIDLEMYNGSKNNLTTSKFDHLQDWVTD